ncbi:LapA family protein [Allosphingosinicella vermicomposti]|uniref:LapA family protein n=1 Tax=Allosphingosinicella vermicomposti TaxID=614671 RepID=UPI0018F89D62|nr:LapA family protein [Allosphingosinicella vermicomposti]
MQFLRTLFWVVLAMTIVLFSSANWTPVTVNLWGGLEAVVKLPVLIFAAFLIGFAPPFAYYRARIWSLRRRVETLERNATPPAMPVESVSSHSLTEAPHPTASDIGPSV